MLSRIIFLLVLLNFCGCIENATHSPSEMDDQAKIWQTDGWHPLRKDFGKFNPYADEETNDNRFILNAVIRQLFELFRNIVLNGCIEKNVPILDPYDIKNATFITEGPILSLEINITKAELVGFGNFELEQFNFSKNELSLEIKMNIPFFYFESDDYELSGMFLEFLPIAGHGRLQFNIQDIIVLGKVYLKQSNDDISVIIDRIENLHFSIKRITSTTEFDSNIDGIINHMIEDLLAGYLNRFNTIISELYEPIVVRYLNTLFNKFETWKIISVLL